MSLKPLRRWVVAGIHMPPGACTTPSLVVQWAAQLPRQLTLAPRWVRRCRWHMGHPVILRSRVAEIPDAVLVQTPFWAKKHPALQGPNAYARFGGRRLPPKTRLPVLRPSRTTGFLRIPSSLACSGMGRR